MNPATNFVVAQVITLGISAIAVAIFWRFLEPVLSEYCGNAKRGRLWTLFSSALVIFAPWFGLSLALPPEHTWNSWIFPLVATVRWPLLAMFIAVVIVAVTALVLHAPRNLPMSRIELDDLRRLVDKIQELRARELISRLESTKPVNPKELDELNQLVDKFQAVRMRYPHGPADAHSAN